MDIKTLQFSIKTLQFSIKTDRIIRLIDYLNNEKIKSDDRIKFEQILYCLIKDTSVEETKEIFSMSYNNYCEYIKQGAN